MKSMWAIAKRDVRSFFVSPLAWVVLTIWMLVCGGHQWMAEQLLQPASRQLLLSAEWR